MMQLVPIKEVYMEEIQVKHPIIDWEVHTEGQRAYWKITRLGGSSASYQFFTDLLKHLDRDDLNQLWSLVKETLSKRPATSDKEMELWDNDSQREEIDIVTETDDVLPLGVENEDDSDGEIDVVDDLHVDNSILNSEHEYSNDEESDFDNPSVPLPPPEPPDEELDFEIDFRDEILVVRDTIVEFECLNPRHEFDVSNDENDDYSYFMFVMF
nr:hypothetical protein [Tanacetum cinerariifolium]